MPLIHQLKGLIRFSDSGLFQMNRRSFGAFGALLAVLFTECSTAGVGPEGSRVCSGPGPPAWRFISCPSPFPLQTVQKPASAGITGQNDHQEKANLAIKVRFSTLCLLVRSALTLLKGFYKPAKLKQVAAKVAEASVFWVCVGVCV